MLQAPAHVAEERRRRGLGIRGAAELGGTSRTTWSKYEQSGKLTKAMRLAVAKAFDWPTTWPESLPALTPLDPGEPTNSDLMAKLDALTTLVRNMGGVVEQIGDQVLSPTKPGAPPAPTSRRSSAARPRPS